MISDGVMVSELVEVTGDSNVTEALRKMDEHKLSSVLVSRDEVVSWSAVSTAFGHGYAPIPVTQKVQACLALHAHCS
jgi:CBS domain-containing protein